MQNIYENGIIQTPLQKNDRLSQKYDCNIFFKREDLQLTNSFKVRPAIYNFLYLKDKIKNNVVVASAGNFASGISYCANKFKIHSTIFVPLNTPQQKIDNISRYGGNYIEIKKQGNNFNECLQLAKEFTLKNKLHFFHPYDSYDTIMGNMTIADEIISQKKDIDYIIVPIGGGGLISGILLYIKKYYPHIKIIGCETKSTNSMYESLYIKKQIQEKNITDNFVEGIAVKTPGTKTFQICQKYLDDLVVVDDNFLCNEMIDLYNYEKIIIEPAGCVSVSTLSFIQQQISGKNVVCILSGSNNDITRYSEIVERSLVYQNKKHYFIIDFVQKPGELKRFINNILDENDDITKFKYLKTSEKEKEKVFIGIYTDNISLIIEKLIQANFTFIKY